MSLNSNPAHKTKKYSHFVVFTPKDTKPKINNPKRHQKIAKWLLLFVFSLFFYGCCAHSPGINTGENSTEMNAIENTTRATVAFVLEHPRLRNTPYCTGFFVRDNRIASAAHCFIETIEVQLPNGRITEITLPGQTVIGKKVLFIRSNEYNSRTRRSIPQRFREAEIVSVDIANDIVILKTTSIEDSSNFVLTLATSQEREHIGSKVFTIGHPANLPFTYLEGVISKIIIEPDNTPFLLQATVPVSEGCSGGALINSLTGEAIGMSDAYVGRMHHLAIFIPANSINRLLENEETRNRLSQPPPGRH